ncbi:MAG TPA: carbohydrate ABC transporter permease [Firmicutes bacterium]|mgnify:FL=1|nr:carbohydrate ABC transporter permease [Bacillota bacterium]
MMEKLTDLYSDAYFRFKKAIFLFVGAIVLGVLVFAYLANVQIDGGTEQTYRTLDVLFYIFCGLLPVAAAAVGFFLYVHAKRQKIWLSRFRKSKLNRRIRTFDVVLAVVIGIFCVLCIYPIIYVLAGSFNQGADYSIGGVWFLPRVFTFENYAVVLQDGDFWMSYGITIARTLLGTATALIYTAIVAYAMSRPNLKFRRVFYWINIFTMFFSGGLVPYFLIIKSIGLYDTFWVYIIPGLYSVYNMIVLQSGFKSISSDIHDAALIDGAGEFRIWWQIYMPLSKPVLATIVLWVAVGHWNSYFDTMIYTNSEELQSLQYFLLKAIQTSSMTEGMPPEMMERLSSQTLSLAAIILSIIPVFCFFPLIRKNFASGIMVGSLKG